MRWITELERGVAVDGLGGGIATIGVFDGLHLGHRAILDRALHWARTETRPAIVLTFTVHPDQVVSGRAPPLLMSLEHRRREFERSGFDAAVALRFDEALRDLSAEAFVDEILVGSLGVRGLVLGHDTAVGRDRRGDAELLDTLGRERGFEVKVVGEISVDGVVVSSTRIRQALSAGDLEEAARLLGRAPTVLGTVVRGDGRGRSIGYPTANLDLVSECPPGGGVYAVLVLHQGRRYQGLCNIGRRPTFREGDGMHLEVHLLGFEGDLYDEELEVVFLARLRAERRFSGPEDLVRQIERDRQLAVPIFRRIQGSPQEA